MERLGQLLSLLATLAQLVEHLICNHEVVGSIPIGGFDLRIAVLANLQTISSAIYAI